MSAVRDHEEAQKYVERGTERRLVNDLDGAIAAYNTALQLDPLNVEAYNNRGNIYSLQEKYDRAIADFTEAIRLDPRNVLAYYNRALEMELKGDLDRSIADYQIALSLQPDPKILANIHTNLGTIYETLGEYQDALANFTRAIDLDPRHILALYNRGFAYERTGEFAQAAADYRRVLELDPAYTQSRYMQAMIDTVDQLQTELKTRLSRYTTTVDQAVADIWPLLAKALEGVQLNATTHDPYVLLNHDTVTSLQNQKLADNDAAPTERQRTGHGD
jgi:tetratricopeptide (TPR) repeat protein